MKKCAYRNCEIEFEDNKVYCCRKHKEYEKTYRDRDKMPPKKLGRPKSIWKSVNQLNDDDRLKLSKIMGQ
jgi:hypothetical protein